MPKDPAILSLAGNIEGSGNKNSDPIFDIIIVDLACVVMSRLTSNNVDPIEIRPGEWLCVEGVTETMLALRHYSGRFQCRKIVCCFEGYPAYRYGLFESYKEDRKTNPKDPRAVILRRSRKYAFNVLKDLLPRQGINTTDYDNLEGDDQLYLATQTAITSGYKKILIVSEDRDHYQLMKYFPSIEIYHPVKRVVVSASNVHEHYYLGDPTWIVVAKALTGDSGDCIPPCVKGLGEKKAQVMCKILQLSGVNPDSQDVFVRLSQIIQNNSENVIERACISCSTTPGRVRSTLEDYVSSGVKTAERNRELVDYRRVPISEATKEDCLRMVSTLRDFEYRRDLIEQSVLNRG